MSPAEVHRITWWMRSYGGPTPKRHVLYANSPAIQSLYKGRLVGWSKHIKAQDAAGVARVKTVDKYVDKSGQVRYKGSKGLRPSESETYLLQNVIFQTAMFNYTCESQTPVLLQVLFHHL